MQSLYGRPGPATHPQPQTCVDVAALSGAPRAQRTWRTLAPAAVAAAPLLLAIALRLLLAATTPLTDPTEGRYAQIALGVVESGDWITPRVVLETDPVPYLGKPPLYFWSAAASMVLFGPSELAARLPTLVATAALLALMWAVLRRLRGQPTADHAVLIAGSSLLVYGAAGTATVDPLLMLFVAGALLCQLALQLEREPRIMRRWSLLVFALLAGGALTKGPVALVLFGLPVVAFMAFRRTLAPLRRHDWWAGLPVFVALAAPWFLIAERHNPGFLRYFFVNENLLRFLTHRYGDLYGTGHQFPRGSALVMFALAALPWSPFVVWRLLCGGRQRIRRVIADDAALFALLGFATTVAFWCLARQLLPAYLLPSLPLFATWVAVAVVDTTHDQPVVRRISTISMLLWGAAVSIAAITIAPGSARSVLDALRELAPALHSPSRVVFAGKTPYSARFYRGDLVSGHPREPVEATIARAFASPNPPLVLVRARDSSRVPETVRPLLQPVMGGKNWLVLTPDGDTAQNDSGAPIDRETASGERGIAPDLRPLHGLATAVQYRKPDHGEPVEHRSTLTTGGRP